MGAKTFNATFYKDKCAQREQYLKELYFNAAFIPDGFRYRIEK